MRIFPLISLALCTLVAGPLLSSCSYLDTSSTGSSERVLTGTVTGRSVVELPPNSELTIRIVDLSLSTGRQDVLGEQTIANLKTLPAPFRVEYRADDAILMRNVAVEARISVNGRLRYITKSAHPVTLGNVNDTHVLEIELAGKP